MTTSVLDDAKRVYHRAWWALLLRGLLGLAVGVLILARPMDSVAAFALVIAFWALFTGFVSITNAIAVRPVVQHWWVLLLSGLVSVGFGIASFYYYPGLALSFAILLAAWWLAITGVLGLYGAMIEKRMGMPWGWSAAFGVVSIAASAFALLAPPVTLAAILGLIAGFSIVTGAIFVAAAFKIRSVVHA